MNDPGNTSDHCPLKIVLKYNDNIQESVSSEHKSKTKIHKFKWTKPFTERFNMHLNNQLDLNFIKNIIESNIDQKNMDLANEFLGKILIKAARLAEKDVYATNTSKKKFDKIFMKTCHLNDEYKFVKQQIKNIYIQRKYLGYRQMNEETKLRKLKKYLRQIQKLVLQTINNNNAYKFEYLFKCKRAIFWKQVAKFRKKNIVNSSNINIEKFKKYYSSCFNLNDSPMLPIYDQIEEEVAVKLNSLKKEIYQIKFNEIQIVSAIKQLNKGKAFGYDSIYAELLINAKSDALMKLMSWFYSEIFNSGINPTNFNISIVTPIPKGKEIATTPENFRPISVSTAFANFFELLLLDNGAFELKNMHSNQFGYQKKISCKHAYFTINEGIHYYNSMKLSVEIAQLDARKAFDALWRTGLYHKLMHQIEHLESQNQHHE